MLMLPKLNKGMKQAMTKLEKASKVIVGAALVIGLSTVATSPIEAQASTASNLAVNANTPTQGAMLLTPASGARMMIADHESHYSHSSHSSHSSHYSHYSSRE